MKAKWRLFHTKAEKIYYKKTGTINFVKESSSDRKRMTPNVKANLHKAMLKLILKERRPIIAKNVWKGRITLEHSDNFISRLTTRHSNQNNVALL